MSLLENLKERLGADIRSGYYSLFESFSLHSWTEEETTQGMTGKDPIQRVHIWNQREENKCVNIAHLFPPFYFQFCDNVTNADGVTCTIVPRLVYGYAELYNHLSS